MRRSAAETREHVLQVAHELFYWNGIRATGVDTIAAEAGVTPTTLYRQFPSKDDLIAAYVERANELCQSWFGQVMADETLAPREKILAIFDAHAEQLRPGGFRGCANMMTLAEFPDSTLPAHRYAVKGKDWLRDRLGELTGDLGVPDAPALADRLYLVMEGAKTATMALGAEGPAAQARALVELILDDALRRT
ncbi:TetR/AcrR family transcriptional regulator [Spirillospora sp. CA-294931]|uniref:TetR/AcrR family transcriptional regulator n=1 Tax=Spirillospora sp. CA-294931 TaxID=3240042 RepID=UPI003D944AA4